MINKAKPPVRVKDADQQRVIDDIYSKLNELVDSVNTAQKGQSSEFSGKAGDLRIVKNKNNENVIEAKTEDGWAQSSTLTLNTR